MCLSTKEIQELTSATAIGNLETSAPIGTENSSEVVSLAFSLHLVITNTI